MRVIEPLGDLVEAFAPVLIILVFFVAMALYAVLIGAGAMALPRVGATLARPVRSLARRLARRLPFRSGPPDDRGDPEFR